MLTDIEQDRRADPMCVDCGGWDIEWMYKCHRHGLEYCRGCSCPECDEEELDEYHNYGWEPNDHD